MKVTEDYRKEVEMQILELIIEGLEKEKIDVPDLPKIGEFVLSTIHSIDEKKELAVKLEELRQKWPIFDHPRIHAHISE